MFVAGLSLAEIAPMSRVIYRRTAPPWHRAKARHKTSSTRYDSAVANSAAFINTSAGLDVSYLVRPNVQIDGHADYTIADYTALSSTPGAPYEQYVTLRIAAMYFPTSNFYIGPLDEFVHRTSNQLNSDFNQNIVMLRLGARL